MNEIDEVVKLHEIDIEKTMNAVNVNEFHEHFTIRLLRYSNIETLYKEHSCATYIKNIEVPTLCINSKNDPISPYENAPVELARKKKNLMFAFTQRGGHVEWFEGMLIPERVRSGGRVCVSG